MNGIMITETKYGMNISIPCTIGYKFVVINYGQDVIGSHLFSVQVQCFLSGTDSFFYETNRYKFFKI